MMRLRVMKEVPMQGFQGRMPIRLRDIRIVCTLAVFAVALGCIAQDAKPSAGSATATAPAQTADAKAQSTNDNKGQKATAADSERKKQIADESAELLNMALALKAEVDKTTKDTLSLNVIKKADQIEKLAKQVKEKMRNSGS
jgi:hypothetical protein